MATDEVIIELVADANGVIKAIKKQVEDPSVKKAGDSLGKKMGMAVVNGIKAVPVTAAFTGVAVAGVGVVAGAIFKKVADVLKDAISTAAIQDEAVNKLNNSLAVTGNFSEKTSKEIQNFASSLQSVTRFGDEAILGQIAYAQQMGASVEQSKAIVAASTDMATALDMDLNQAVRNIAKTLGGYSGELGEVIPELKNLSTEQLRAGEGVKLLTDRFKGFAELSANTFTGKLTQLKNTFGDTKEAMGKVFVESGLVLYSFDLAKKALERFAKNTDFKPLVKAMQTVALGALKMLDSFLLLSAQTAKFFGSEGMQKFFHESAIAVRNLRTEINAISTTEARRYEINQQNALNEQNALAQKMKKLNEVAEAQRLAAEKEKEIAEERKKRLDEQNKIQDDFKKNLLTNFIGGITQGFEAMGAAFVNGGNGFEEFGKVALKALGQLAIQTGSFLILTGLGMSAVGSFLGLSGTKAVAAGVGLTVLGGAIMALAGGGGKKEGANASSASSSGAGGGIGSSGAGGMVGEGSTATSFEGRDRMEKQSNVSLTIMGDVFDNEQTGTKILELLQNEFDYKNGKVSYA